MNYHKLIYNIMIFPFVICIRIPIMSILFILSEIGHQADKVINRISVKLPGFER